MSEKIYKNLFDSAASEKSGKRVIFCPLIFNEEAELLAMKRAPGTVHHPEKWGFPGGAQDEEDTSIEDIIRREIPYKTNQDALAAIPIATIEKGNAIFVYYAVALTDGEVRISEEHTDHKWVAIDQWPQPEYPGTTEFLKTYKKQILAAYESLGKKHQEQHFRYF